MIAPDLGGLAELVIDGQTGRLTKPGSSADLAAGIDDVLRASAGSVMRSQARRFFDRRLTRTRQFQS